MNSHVISIAGKLSNKSSIEGIGKKKKKSHYCRGFLKCSIGSVEHVQG